MRGIYRKARPPSRAGFEREQQHTHSVESFLMLMEIQNELNLQYQGSSPPPNFRETINTVRHIVPGQVIANYTELSQNRSRSLVLLSNKSQPLQILLLCLPGASG